MSDEYIPAPGEFVGPPAPGLLDLAYRLNMTGPMITKHFAEGDFNDWHPGLGAELQATPYNGNSGMNLAAGGHYMTVDSFGNPMWWAGVTPSYTFGDREGFWVEPGLMGGMMSKQEINEGDPTPFALPRVGVGYGPVGLDVGYIPATPMNREPIGLLQLRGVYDF